MSNCDPIYIYLQSMVENYFLKWLWDFGSILISYITKKKSLLKWKNGEFSKESLWLVVESIELFIMDFFNIKILNMVYLFWDPDRFGYAKII